MPLLSLPLLLLLSAAAPKPMQTPAYVPFTGEKTSWHDGFDRYDYVMDDATLAVKPFRRPDNEGSGVAGPAQGESRCIVVCPKHPAPGNPWSWQGCYWDHQPQAEVELLHRGFHIAYITADADRKPDRRWEAWYDYLTKGHGLSPKPCFVGMSRGGQYELRWATTHPDRVSGIYADNPAADDDIFRNLLPLIRNDVPILFVCGTNDPLLAGNALPLEAMFQRFGGRASMMLKEGYGHHPHSLSDPKPIADFLEASFRTPPPAVPDFVGDNRFERTSFYGVENHYAPYPQDNAFITTRGAAFSDCYDQYRIILGFETPVTVIAPKQAAPGRPWVLRSSHVERDAMLDRALLAKGYHIVVGPIGYNADGPKAEDWSKMFAYLTDHGFAKKAVLEGEGGAAGTIYGWAVANPEKIDCIVAKNPILQVPGLDSPTLDHLTNLAAAKVRILHICDNLDPALTSDERTFEQRYRATNAPLTVLTNPGPTEVQQTLNFISGK